ncbi:hypothetical protein Acsp06_39710 [Actinomycetospora sp. NBRC 106375]|nr:hypothetical protein [Actinomycetospora sp. NBRC 106375]GLZ47786.1 hypothetical protein Acsp06_39710 [Actinomycetospora sp. NBRC 106375]
MDPVHPATTPDDVETAVAATPEPDPDIAALHAAEAVANDYHPER